MIRKLRTRRGMTLLECLVAVLILALLAGTILTGGRAALRTYRSAVFDSESQLLADTINAALQDVLHYTTKVTVNTNDAVTAYTCPPYEIIDAAFLVEDEGTDAGQIFLDGATELRLLSNAAYTTLYVQNFSVICDRSKGIFTVWYQLYDPLNDQTTEQISFACRAVNLLSDETPEGEEP